VKALEARKPAAISARGPHDIDQLPGQINVEATLSLPKFQAAHLVLRFGLAPHLAELIATLAFQNARRVA
jgi:hypothetical protein